MKLEIGHAYKQKPIIKYIRKSEIISMAQAVPNLCVNQKIFTEHQVNRNIVYGAIPDLPW